MRKRGQRSSREEDRGRLRSAEAEAARGLGGAPHGERQTLPAGREGRRGPTKPAGSCGEDAGGRGPALSFKPPSPSPFAHPMRSSPRAAEAPAHRPLRISASGSNPWDSSAPRCEEKKRPLPELPRVEPLTVPPVPATLRHYRGPRSSTRRPGVPYWSEESSIPCERGGDIRDL